MRQLMLIALMVLTLHAAGQSKAVNSPAALKAAVAAAAPGDVILIATGEWKDAKIVVQGKGSAKKPVYVMPEKPGGLVISGASSLRLAGEHLVLKGFHFKNGFSEGKDLISFRVNNDKLANNCRITEFVIEDFNPSDRFKNDNWVVLWGKNNRVDHCTFVDKLNAGPTLIVELNDERSQQNYHSIDSNYFKGRQRLGSNGGETMRIGVSRYSLTPSRTRVVSNYFERCSGEAEIISVKSGENEVSFNTFFECEGSVVLRHGNDNVVKGNLFLGNGKPFTGGVRVINPGHKIFNNVFKDLRGFNFRAPLSVMNGVPNSLINRYHQVRNAEIYQNTFENCSTIEFGAGKDAERTLAPENVKFSNNLIVSPADTLFRDHNGSGIIFLQNAVEAKKGKDLAAGFKRVQVKSKKVAGIDFPLPVSGAGADIRPEFITDPRNVGADWYQFPATAVIKGKRIEVDATQSKRLPKIVEGASVNDTIVFTGRDVYKLEEVMRVRKPLAFMAAGHLTERPVLVSIADKTLPGFIVIEDGGSAAVEGLAFAGAFESYGSVRSGITTSDEPMVHHYKLRVNNCEFFDFNESTFSGIKAGKSTYADSIVVRNSLFRNISGTGIDLAAEKDDKGIYNAEYTIVENCVFTRILGSAVNLYRGGNDESTTGPSLKIDHCTFHEVDNKEQGSVLRFLGVQDAKITNCIFSKSGQGGRSVQFQESRFDRLLVDYCNLYESGRIDSFYGRLQGAHIYQQPPGFMEPESGNFNLKEDSSLKNKSISGGALGAHTRRVE